jgi:hypothetical protein
MHRHGGWGKGGQAVYNVEKRRRPMVTGPVNFW